jgi:uncharacterized damage-inducible protein DinB
MGTADILLKTFDQEMKGTGVVLERIPEDRVDFKPHDKSMPMGRLAAHVARLPRLLITLLTTPSLDMAAAKWPPLVYESREKVLAEFAAGTAEARKLLAGATDAQLDQPWKLAWGEKVLAEGPRSILYFSMFLNHVVHHRAQLGVYLRLNDRPVPALYGPSADDGMGL